MVFCRYPMIFSAGMLYYIVMCDVAGKVLLPTTGTIGMGIVSSFFPSILSFLFFCWGDFFSFMSGYPGPSCIRFVSLVCMYACTVLE